MNNINKGKIKNIIFDLDGTLINSLNVWEKIDKQFLQEYNCVLDEDYYNTALKLPFVDCIKYMLEKFCIPLSLNDAIIWFKERSIYEYKTNINFKEGAIEFLKKLSEKNINLAIATSCPRLCCMAILEKYNLVGLFKIISFTEEDNYLKTQNEYYKYLLEKLNANAHETIMYEDMYFACASAKDIGISCIGISNNNTSILYNKRLKKYIERCIINFNNEYEKIKGFL